MLVDGVPLYSCHTLATEAAGKKILTIEGVGDEKNLHPLQRIGLMGSFVIGLATTRYVLENPPIANISRDELSRWAAPVITQILVGPAPE